MINLQLERIFLIQEYLYLKQEYIFLSSHEEIHNFLLMFSQVIKCDDAKCCSPFRSDLRSILQSGFLPPPLLIKQDSALERLVAAAPMENNNSAKFLPLFQRLAIKIPILGEAEIKMVPYDFYCPTVQKDLEGRICAVCGLYFGSKKNEILHRKSVHSVIYKPRKKKPTRVVAQRDEELLCVVHDDMTGGEDCEWVNMDEVDITQEAVAKILHIGKELLGFPVIPSLQEWLTTPWTTDE